MFHLPGNSNSGASKAYLRQDNNVQEQRNPNYHVQGHVSMSGGHQDQMQDDPISQVQTYSDYQDEVQNQRSSNSEAQDSNSLLNIQKSHLNIHTSGPLNDSRVNFSIEERQILWVLSILERDSMETQLTLMNKDCDEGKGYSEDDPKVRLLANQAYLILAKGYTSTLGSLGFEDGRLDHLIGDAGAMARAHFRSQYRELLEMATTRQSIEVHSPLSADRKVAASTSPATTTRSGILSPVSGQFPPIFTFSQAQGPPKFQSQYAADYEEIGLLGKGGYGHVYCVRSHADKQKYAVKKIPLSSTSLKKSRKKAHVKELLCELRTMAKLDHPNVVRYYHGWIEAGLPASETDDEDQASELGKLPRQSTSGSTSGYKETNNMDLASLQIQVEDLGDLDRSVNAQNYEPADDNVVFGYSSPEASQARESIGRDRRFSTLTSTSPLIGTVRRLNTAHDPDSENIPSSSSSGDISLVLSRPISSPEKSVLHVTPDPSEDSSEPNIFLGQGIIIHIKMSLHPLTLLQYLSTDEIAPEDPCRIRHCFHQENTVALLAAILDGIEYLHGEKIVHRDLKPANILLSVRFDRPSSSGGSINIRSCSECGPTLELGGIYVTPCIGDFGLVAKLKDLPRATDATLGASSSAPREETGPKPIPSFLPRPVGTAFYRPSTTPNHEPYICQKLDVYSLGVIAFEMIYSFSTRSERAMVLTDLKKGKLPALTEGHDMAAGIKHMVCEDRDQRWGCKEVRNWLQSLVGKGKQLA